MYRLILVEDEKLIREGIIRLIQNNETGFELAGDASDGEQGLALAKSTNPDVVITDIYMPKMNGLDLVESIAEYNPEVKFIIVSGYDDFRYAQRALRLGALDYILKPVLPEQIREILLKARDELDKRKNLLLNMENLKSRVIESLPILRERFFNQLISGSLNEEQIAEKLRYLDIDMAGELYDVLLLKIRNPVDISGAGLRREDLLQYFLINVMNEVFDKDILVYPFPVSDSKIVLIACAKQCDRQNVFISLNKNAVKIVAKLQKYLGVQAYVSIGRLYRNIRETDKSYREACEAIQFVFSRDGCCVINYEDICIQNAAPQKKPLELENQMFVGIRLGDRKIALQAMEKIFAGFTEYAPGNPLLVKMEIFELVMLLARSMEEAGAPGNNLFGDADAMPYERIQSSDSLEELKSWLTGIVDECIHRYDRAKLSKSAAAVEKMKEYIGAGLHSEDFTLDEVAKKLYMSPNYLRQIFKQYTGESFVDYLTARRMEKAAALLKDDVLKVQDIAEKVGYSNQRYFASCFKRYHKLTPTEYRELHGVGQQE